MASQPIFTVTSTTLRKTSMVIYPFALALGIPFAVDAYKLPYSDFDQDTSSFCSLSFVSMTFSFLFSLSLVYLPVPLLLSRLIKDEDSKRKIRTYSKFTMDLVLAIVLLASVAYTCARLPYFGGYYYQSPRDLMLGTYATVTLMINMYAPFALFAHRTNANRCIHGFFVVRALYQRFPVEYGGYKGTRSSAGSHVHRDWPGRERVYTDVEHMSVGVLETDEKRSFGG
jgi:hypothetical protein